MVLCDKCSSILISEKGVAAIKKSIADHKVQTYLDLWKSETGADFNIEFGNMTVSDMIHLAEKFVSIEKGILLTAYTHAYIAVSGNAPELDCSTCLEEIFYWGSYAYKH